MQLDLGRVIVEIARPGLLSMNTVVVSDCASTSSGWCGGAYHQLEQAARDPVIAHLGERVELLSSIDLCDECPSNNRPRDHPRRPLHVLAHSPISRSAFDMVSSRSLIARDVGDNKPRPVQTSSEKLTNERSS